MIQEPDTTLVQAAIDGDPKRNQRNKESGGAKRGKQLRAGPFADQADYRNGRLFYALLFQDSG